MNKLFFLACISLIFFTAASSWVDGNSNSEKEFFMDIYKKDMKISELLDELAITILDIEKNHKDEEKFYILIDKTLEYIYIIEELIHEEMS